MNDSPPPNPDTTVTPVPEPTSDRRRLALAAVVASTVAVGGIAAGSHFASADRASLVSATESAAPADDTGDDEREPVESDEATDDEDAPADDTEPDSETDGTDTDDSNGGFDEIEERFEEFDACLAEQLPDLFGDDGVFGDGDIEFDDEPFIDGEFGPFDGNGSVTVVVPGGDEDDGEFVVVDFGEGDGSVTVTKTGDDVNVETSGDAEQLDLDALEAEWDDTADEWEADWEERSDEIDAAHDACADLLPDFDLGDVDFGDFELPEIDLDDIADLSDIDPTDFGLPEDFDLSELELPDLSEIDIENLDPTDFGLPEDFELPEFDLDDLDLGDIELPAEFDDLLADIGLGN